MSARGFQRLQAPRRPNEANDAAVEYVSALIQHDVLGQHDRKLGWIHILQFQNRLQLPREISPADDFGGGFEDILPLSHEIGEWANDPYTNNIVPAWQEPDGLGKLRGNLLEVGDPVEIFPSPSFPSLLDGYVYHPQTLALLQWFSRETLSSAIDGAYSYGNESILTSPSLACASAAATTAATVKK